MMKTTGVLLVGGFLSLLFGCSSSTPPSTVLVSPRPTVDAPAPLPKGPETQPSVFVATGPVVVEQQVDMTSLRDGIVAELNADVGTRVKKGQLLARLDSRQLAADRGAAEHKWRSIEADVKNWEEEVKVREVDLKRSEEMLKAGIVTQQQVDHDRYNVNASKYEVDRERENGLNARSTLQSADLELEKTNVRAPFDGIIARRYVREGQRVANGEKLFWVTAVEPLQVRFTLPEQYSRSLKPGDQLSVAPAAAPEEPSYARVAHVSPVVDPASGTVEVIAVINKHSSFRPGMTASIRIPIHP